MTNRKDKEALSRAQELAELYMADPEVTRRNTRVHFIHPLKERIAREVGYGLSLGDVGRRSRKIDVDKEQSIRLKQKNPVKTLKNYR